ncbi:MAG TPA: histidinol-phosphatase HisJ family protein [Bacillota bacterium]|nr:histidinol-phosphatase HisJ family protein [Bacillota bacterium]
MFDYHMHSNFSADCKTPMEKTIERAIEIGLKEICFTDHIDYEYPDPNFIFEFDFQAYDAKITKMQERYGDKITIKKGVEVGVQPHILHKYEKMMTEESFDFVICSMHTTNKQGLHSGDLFVGRTVDEAYELYYEELLQCIKNFEQYSVLGHLDLVKRYKENLSGNNFHEIIEQMFKIIIPQGKGIEINTSGYRDGLDQAMPSIDILQLYKDCGGEIITLGSDSHVPETLAEYFPKSLSLLQSLGFKYVATFNQMKPIFHPIASLL